MQLQYIAGQSMPIHRALLFISLALLAACSDSGSPEQQVRAVIEQMERAAENRDVGELASHLSEEYRDANGMGADEASRFLGKAGDAPRHVSSAVSMAQAASVL